MIAVIGIGRAVERNPVIGSGIPSEIFSNSVILISIIGVNALKYINPSAVAPCLTDKCGYMVVCIEGKDGLDRTTPCTGDAVPFKILRQYFIAVSIVG